MFSEIRSWRNDLSHKKEQEAQKGRCRYFAYFGLFAAKTW